MITPDPLPTPPPLFLWLVMQIELFAAGWRESSNGGELNLNGLVLYNMSERNYADTTR